MSVSMKQPVMMRSGHSLTVLVWPFRTLPSRQGRSPFILRAGLMSLIALFRFLAILVVGGFSPSLRRVWGRRALLAAFHPVSIFLLPASAAPVVGFSTPLIRSHVRPQDELLCFAAFRLSPHPPGHPGHPLSSPSLSRASRMTPPAVHPSHLAQSDSWKSR